MDQLNPSRIDLMHRLGEMKRLLLLLRNFFKRNPVYYYYDCRGPIL
jgi:hypothetical protein